MNDSNKSQAVARAADPAEAGLRDEIVRTGGKVFLLIGNRPSSPLTCEQIDDLRRHFPS